MADKYQFIRGTETENDNYVGPEGSLSVDLDNDEARLHDGSTAGGTAMQKKEVTTSTGTQTVAEALNQRVSAYTPEMFGATGVGIETSAVQSAVSSAIANNSNVFWSRSYEIDDNIEGFFDCGHLGNGSLTRDGETWKITMGLFDDNKIYVAPSGLSTNDGLSPSFPKTPLSAFNAFRQIRYPSSVGKYSIVFIDGTYTDRGLRMSRMPFVSQAFSIRAQNITTPPSVVWDGTGNIESFGLSAEATSALQYLDIEGIHFDNWSSGAFVFDGNVILTADKCEFSNLGTYGTWIRQGRCTIRNSVYRNIGTLGAMAQYQSRMNVLNCIFDNVGSRGVHYGRNSAGHVRDCAFDNIDNSCIQATMSSRVRTFRNNFNSFGREAIEVSDCSTWNNSSDAEPDVFTGISSTNIPVSVKGNSSPPHLDNFGGNLSSRTPPQASTYTVPGAEGERVNLLVSVDASIRTPNYLLYNPNARVRVEVDYSVSSSGSFKVELAGAGESAANVWGSIDVEGSADGTYGTLSIEATGAPDGSNGRFIASCVASGKTFVNGGTALIDDAPSRSKDPTIVPRRLYVTKTTAGTTLVIRSVRVYIYA